MATATQTTPTLVQSHGGGGGCTSSNKVTLSSQPAAGDLIVIYAQLNNTSVRLSAPSGFSTKDTKSGGWFQAAEYYKIATGTEGTTYTVGSTCSGGALTWIAADVRGENQSNPFDAHNSNVTTATGISRFTTLTLTPSHANDLPISVIAPGSNGLTVSSFSPSAWGLKATGAYFTQKLWAGPPASTSAVSFAESTSTATGWASLATLDLINAAGSTSTTTATPAPAPTSAPTAAPTSAPAPAGAYTFHGTRVYPSCDWFTTPLNVTPSCSSYAVSTVDPNSAHIIANFNASSVCGGSCKLSINASSPAVTTSGIPGNASASTTPKYVVQGCAYGCSNDVYNDNPTKSIPFQSGFATQGTCKNTSSYYGDCHVVVAAPNGVDYETYQYMPAGGSPFNGSTYTSESLSTYNLNQPYHASGSGVTASALPLLGTEDFGEDASLPSIDHVAYMILPGTDASPVASGGHVAPATAGPACASACTYKLPFGARLRLNPSKYTCPSASTNPQAHKICVQLETYGMIVMDHGIGNGTFGISIGPSSNGSNPWNPTDINAISNTGGHGIPLSDFDVITMGTVY